MIKGESASLNRPGYETVLVHARNHSDRNDNSCVMHNRVIEGSEVPKEVAKNRSKEQLEELKYNARRTARSMARINKSMYGDDKCFCWLYLGFLSFIIDSGNNGMCKGIPPLEPSKRLQRDDFEEFEYPLCEFFKKKYQNHAYITERIYYGDIRRAELESMAVEAHLRATCW